MKIDLDKLQNLKIPLLQDPKSKAPSISLTLLMASFAVVLVASGLYLGKKIESLGPVMELFYSCAALYFGRRTKFGGKEYNAEGDQGQ